MRMLNRLALFVGLTAMVGCADEPEQSLNGVFPASGFTGRKVRVEVSADNVAFEEGKVSLDFGSGVTVSSVTIASPSALFAEIEIAGTAPIGTHDVVVHNGNDTLTLKQAFKLESPVAVRLDGTLAQGSVVTFTATNLDLTNLYDTTCGATFLGICLLYTGVRVEGPLGVTAVLDTVEPFRITGTLFVDVDAQSGDISFVSGPADDPELQVTSAMGATTQFPARSPVVLPAGIPSTATVEAAFDSQLYSFDTSSNALARVRVSPSSTAANPTVYVLPASGHFSEMIIASEAPNVISDAAGSFYAIYFDARGASGYSYAIRENPLALAPLTENDGGAGNNTLATAQTGTAPMIFKAAMFASQTDEDWFRFPVSASDVDKSVHVVTSGDSRTDTWVHVYADTAADELGSQDTGIHEDFVSAAIPAGTTTIHVNITPSTPQFYDPAHNTYVVAVWVE